MCRPLRSSCRIRAVDLSFPFYIFYLYIFAWRNLWRIRKKRRKEPRRGGCRGACLPVEQREKEGKGVSIRKFLAQKSKSYGLSCEERRRRRRRKEHFRRRRSSKRAKSAAMSPTAKS